MTTIEITAYESVEVVGLSATHARLLAATKAVNVTPGWGPEAWSLSAGPYVGVLRCEDLELRIRPRISIARLIFLLGYTNDPRTWRDDPAGLEDQLDLWPAMAQVFSRQAEKALERGLLQGYRTEESARFVLRGRLREADQLRLHAGLPLPLELRFDEYDIDIPENRLLRAATERLLRVPRLPSVAARRLRHLRGRLAEVSPLIPGQPLPATTASRLNQRYQPALALARMILRTRSVDVLDAGVRATGFLVNMNTVFEDFVTVALSEALRPYGGRSVAQDTAHTLDVGRAIRLKPDLVHYDALGRPDAVVDAKYKAETPSGYPYADLYQMLSYCTALGLAAGQLIYAQGESSAARHDVVNAGVTVVQHALNLRQPARGLLADIDRLAGLLVQRASSSICS
jgi:5-methylcytosine-specific restriction enzyme subunit McrC